MYEYPLPADSPWRQVSYAQIRCLRTPAPEQTGSPLTASALGNHRSPGVLERAESWVGNTPLLLRADRPELCRTILTHGAAKPVLRFFRRWTAAGISSVSAGAASLSLPGTAAWISTGAAGKGSVPRRSAGTPPQCAGFCR